MVHRILILSALLLTLAVPAWAQGAAGTFQDNANNEQGFKLERVSVATPAACLPDQAAATSPACKTAVTTACAAVTTGFVQVGANLPAVGVVAPSTAPWSDATVTEGVAYCWRLLAFNTAGNSGYSNTAGKFVIFTVPQAPTNFAVN